MMAMKYHKKQKNIFEKNALKKKYILFILSHSSVMRLLLRNVMLRVSEGERSLVLATVNLPTPCSLPWHSITSPGVTPPTTNTMIQGFSLG